MSDEPTMNGAAGHDAAESVDEVMKQMGIPSAHSANQPLPRSRR